MPLQDRGLENVMSLLNDTLGISTISIVFTIEIGRIPTAPPPMLSPPPNCSSCFLNHWQDWKEVVCLPQIGEWQANWVKQNLGRRKSSAGM